MNIFEIIKQEIATITQQEFVEQVNISNVSVELPKDKSHGDLATNAAMIIAKQIQSSPVAIAQKIITKLEQHDLIQSCEIAGPGFINMRLKTSTWHLLLEQIYSLGENYGSSNIGLGQKVNIEFVSCNPTGPMHIGHSRGAIYGDVLSNLMEKCGYEVCREFYINDAGAQVDVLAKSAYIRYLQAAGDKDLTIPEGLYPGEYLIEVGDNLFKQYGDELKHMEEAKRLELIKRFAVDAMMISIKNDLIELGVKHDVFFSEKTLHDEKKIDKLIQQFLTKGIVYKGVLPPPKGKKSDDWEAREQLLLKSTDFGDDIDRSMQKSNGEWTYAAADVAYMKNKLDRGFNNITMILGADHLGYKKRMQATVYALAGDTVNFQIRFCQIVNFLQNGQPMKMSKRKGTFITVEDVLSEVDKDIVRFMMLTRRNDQILDFDLEKVKEQSKDNPVFYVQYANARINSILTNALSKNQDYQIDDNINLSSLVREEELSLIRFLANWPKIIELACLHQEPHRIAFYLIELASEFHSFWSKGNEDSSLRFIIENDTNLTKARLKLAKSISLVIQAALKIFNVKPIIKM
jgi:arginyl-tRNA synthetase